MGSLACIDQTRCPQESMQKLELCQALGGPTGLTLAHPAATTERARLSLPQKMLPNSLPGTASKV